MNNNMNGEMPNQMPNGQPMGPQPMPGPMGPMPNGQPPMGPGPMPNGQPPMGQPGMYNQMYQPKPKKPVNKKLIGIILGAVAAFFLLIIGLIVLIIFLNMRLDRKDPQSVVEHYVEYLQEGKFDKAYELVYVPESEFINAKDYETIMKSSEIYTNISINKDKDVNTREPIAVGEKVTVSYSFGKASLFDFQMFTLVKDKDENWQIEYSSLYYSSVTVRVPIGATLTLDGKKITTGKTEGYSYDSYEIKNVARTEKKYTIKHAFGTTEEKKNSSYFTIEAKPDDKTLKSAYAFLADSWNAMYKEYKGTKNVDNIKKYFNSDVYDSSIALVFSSYFPYLESGSSYFSSTKYTDMSVSDVKNTTSTYSTSSVISSTKIKVYFNYKINYTYNGEKKSNTINTYAYLEYKDGGFKYYEMPSSFLRYVY